MRSASSWEGTIEGESWSPRPLKAQPACVHHHRLLESQPAVKAFERFRQEEVSGDAIDAGEARGGPEGRPRAEFTEAEQVNLTLAIGAINVWNRLQVGFRAAHPVG